MSEASAPFCSHAPTPPLHATDNDIFFLHCYKAFRIFKLSPPVRTGTSFSRKKVLVTTLGVVVSKCTSMFTLSLCVTKRSEM